MKAENGHVFPEVDAQPSVEGICGIGDGPYSEMEKRAFRQTNGTPDLYRLHDLVFGKKSAGGAKDLFGAHAEPSFRPCAGNTGTTTTTLPSGHAGDSL